jgi:hypothetical protein
LSSSTSSIVSECAKSWLAEFHSEINALTAVSRLEAKAIESSISFEAKGFDSSVSFGDKEFESSE